MGQLESLLFLQYQQLCMKFLSNIILVFLTLQGKDFTKCHFGIVTLTSPELCGHLGMAAKGEQGEETTGSVNKRRKTSPQSGLQAS